MSLGEIAAYILVAGMILTVCLLFFKPLKGFFGLLFRSVLGGVGLYIVNFALGLAGVSVGVNIVTASVCGLLGIPGVILLVLLKIVYSYM